MPYCLSFLSTSTADIISKYPIVQTLAYSEKDPCNRRHRHTTRTLARSPYLALSIRKYLGVEEAEPTENENVHISLKSSPLKLHQEMHPFRIFLAASFLFQSSEQTPVSNAERGLQVPLADLAVTHTESTTSQTLHGRFLHITGWGNPNLISWTTLISGRSTSGCLLQGPLFHGGRRCLPSRQRHFGDLWRRNFRL
jgi:hypothetical protein